MKSGKERGKMIVAVYTVALNEEKFVKRWYESAKDADYLLIADTGSTDRTVELAEKLGINVIKISIKPWRFDDARNAALAALPDDVDYCISLDMDELLAPGWRKELEKAYKNKLTRPRYRYIWNFNEDGTPGIEFGGDHIHLRHNYRWKTPVHEILVSDRMGETVGWIDLEIHHKADASKSRSQYLPLLKLSVDEDPYNDRNAFYYARELFFHNMYAEAAVEFERHLSLPSARWGAERAASYRYLAKCEPKNAEQHLKSAINEDPNRREAKVELAKFYYEQGNWPPCYEQAVAALNIKEKPMDYLCEDFAWQWLPYDLACISLWWVGRKEEALENELEALRHNPNDKRMMDNFKLMVREVHNKKITAVIPSKSNFDGALKVIESLKSDSQVQEIVLVADGEISYKKYKKLLVKSGVTLTHVPEGSGIQVMWNVGIEIARKNKTALFLVNDDLDLDQDTAGTLSSLLEYNKNISLISAGYDAKPFKNPVYKVVSNARGVYRQDDGLAGCCMALSSELVEVYNFDERLTWWFGDDDIVNWCEDNAHGVAVTNLVEYQNNTSYTTKNNPPANFESITKNDQKIFEEKWKIK